MHTGKLDRRCARGVASLSVALLLVFALSLVVVYLNRSLIFEQRASINLLHATTALEAAEAGIEWANGMLNAPPHIDAACQPGLDASDSFRSRYLPAGAPVAALPGCKLGASGLACQCPTPAAAARPDAQRLPGFRVAFEPVVSAATGLVDPLAVRVTASGCAAQIAPCDTAAAADGGARATVTAVLKLRPLLRALPSAALTCGADCGVQAGAQLANDDVARHGLLVQAGGSIDAAPDAIYRTVPGQPVDAALAGGDAALAGLHGSDPTCERSALFHRHFGTDIARYARPENGVLALPNCSAPADCSERLAAAYRQGWRAFHFAHGVTLEGGAALATLGSASDGVQLVSDGPVRLTGPLAIHGLLFFNHAAPDDLDLGSAELHGAVIACGSARVEGTARLQYAASALTGSGLGTGPMVRVPGSWHRP